MCYFLNCLVFPWLIWAYDLAHALVYVDFDCNYKVNLAWVWWNGPVFHGPASPTSATGPDRRKIQDFINVLVPIIKSRQLLLSSPKNQFRWADFGQNLYGRQVPSLTDRKISLKRCCQATASNHQSGKGHSVSLLATDSEMFHPWTERKSSPKRCC